MEESVKVSRTDTVGTASLLQLHEEMLGGSELACCLISLHAIFTIYLLQRIYDLMHNILPNAHTNAGSQSV